jgi:hypothetical protein
VAHPLFEQLAHNPEPSLNAEHPAPAPAGDVPKGWKHLPDAPKVSQQVHSQAKGIHSDAEFFPFPEEYEQTTTGKRK